MRAKTRPPGIGPIERGLLERADAAAAEMHVSRAALIAMGLEKMLSEQSAGDS